MTIQEFTDRTGFVPTQEQFNEIHEQYMDTDMDKDHFCKMWKRKNGIAQCSADMVQEISTLKCRLDGEQQSSQTYARLFYEEHAEVMRLRRVLGQYQEAIKKINNGITELNSL